MRATILPYAVILTKAHRAFLPNYSNFPTIPILSFSMCTIYDKPEVSLPKYSQTAKLHGAHFPQREYWTFYNSPPLFKFLDPPLVMVSNPP